MSDVLRLCVGLAMTFFLGGMLLTLIRLFRGPSVPDRVVALDLCSALTVGFIATYCVYTGKSVFLDNAVVLALISFLGTVAFARYLERRT